MSKQILSRPDDSARFVRYVYDFINKQPQNPRFKTKMFHSFSVAKNSVEIAKALHLSEEEQDIAWVIGILHDIGRFNQAYNYGTFMDKKSIPHAQESINVLFNCDPMLIRRYINENCYDVIIFKAILHHSDKELPLDLTEKEKLFCQILQDADKIDILRSGFTEPLNVYLSEPKFEKFTSRISTEIKVDILSHRLVDSSHIENSSDAYIAALSFVYGLHYDASRAILYNSGYLSRYIERYIVNCSDDNIKIEGVEMHHAVLNFLSNSGKERISLC